MRSLLGQLVVPPAVISELDEGRRLGVDLPDLHTMNWVMVHTPQSEIGAQLVTDLGPGESQVLLLALERPDAIVVLDDGLARQIAEALDLRLTGTLGLLLDAKRAGIVPAVTPLLDQLQDLRFRLAPQTRSAVLKLAEE